MKLKVFSQRFVGMVGFLPYRLTHGALRIMAEPPIKGKITKGKVRWRGIRMIQYNDGFKYTKWLEQRGKQISPKIIFTGTIGNGL